MGSADNVSMFKSLAIIPIIYVEFNTMEISVCDICSYVQLTLQESNTSKVILFQI